MIRLEKVDSSDLDFIELVRQLDIDLAIRDGDEHAFYAQYNGIDQLKNVVVAYEGDTPIACGAIKLIEPGVMEVKRMYTIPSHRGKGIASVILSALENWAANLGASYCRLETGKKQPEAIALYRKNNYEVISNYGQYVGVENSVCFEKRLI